MTGGLMRCAGTRLETAAVETMGAAVVVAVGRVRPEALMAVAWEDWKAERTGVAAVATAGR